MQTGVPARTAAWSSCIVWRKSPSPQIARTSRSGFASCAPIAAGSVKPIVEKPPDVRWVRGRRVTQRCLTMPCGRPAPVTTIASSRVAAWTSRTARAIVIGVASEPDLTSTCSNQLGSQPLRSRRRRRSRSRLPPGPSAASRSASAAARIADERRRRRGSSCRSRAGRCRAGSAASAGSRTSRRARHDDADQSMKRQPTDRITSADAASALPIVEPVSPIVWAGELDGSRRSRPCRSRS